MQNHGYRFMYIVATITLHSTVAFVIPCCADNITHDVAKRTPLEFQHTPKEYVSNLVGDAAGNSLKISVASLFQAAFQLLSAAKVSLQGFAIPKTVAFLSS
jgi:hypothetical protein